MILHNFRKIRNFFNIYGNHGNGLLGTNPLANVTDYANKKLNQTEYELEQAIK